MPSMPVALKTSVSLSPLKFPNFSLSMVTVDSLSVCQPPVPLTDIRQP